ncbi:hypothetical protein K474DRAFT_128816 [Panus rudis PR-1116 ss-1]|nr:hypothetical protein K474DRAFT_128816 [Panus rudis PR-1116 ss-1]
MAGPPESSVKPRISLEGLNLHSPSSILGTPFDVSSPRFEYPFPPGGVESDQVPSITSPVSSMSSGSSMSPIQMMTGFFPSTAPSMAMPIPVPQRHSHRNENSRAFFPTHNKHITKDPPMPPGLAKRRLAAGNSVAAQSPRIDSPRSISEERKASSATSNVTGTQSRRTSLDTARPPSVTVLASSPIPRKTSSS